MKQEKNNEIDLLLRRLSRRHEVPLTDVDSDHLDADELSSYAENALPAAARARYTEHLADCSKCREIVVQLNASVPVAVAKETVPVVASSGLRKFLASLFSPIVLRYAVPALGLIIVAAIGFSVLRSRQTPMDTAQADRQVQSPAATTNTSESSAKGFSNYDDAQSNSSSPAVKRQSNTDKPVATAEEPPPPNDPPSGDIAAAKTEASAQRPAEPAAANAAPAQAERVPAAAPTVDEMRVDIQGRRNEQSGPAQAREVAKQKSAEGFQAQEEQEKKVTVAQSTTESAPKTGAAATTQTGRSFGLMDKAGKDRDADDGVMRTVAGRRFRKQSGMWVDTAYSSGNKISEIARGSERYRSLVADEPEIKKIADELGGVVIVVWKDRTYRIR